MSDDEILALIREALIYAAPDHKEQFEQVDWTSTLSSLGLDSIGLLDASAYIEEKLGAHFPDDKLAVVDNVSDFAKLIREHSQANVPVVERG